MSRAIRFVTAVAVASSLCAAWRAGSARACPNHPADYVFAETPLHTGLVGGQGVATAVELQLCATAQQFELCSLLERGTFFAQPAPAGTTFWIDSNDPGFDVLVARLTNGTNGFVHYLVSPSPGNGGGGGHGTSESLFFGNQVGPSGADLAGYSIHRVGLRVDALTMASPGADPNGDGSWTDMAIDGAFVFEGTIASPQACKNNGWQKLHRPGGVAFASLGDCIHFVITGK
jgi:hypothetical protein